MRPFEEVVAAELLGLLRAGAPARAVRLTVRELVVARLERGPLGPLEVTDTTESVIRAACRLVRSVEAPEELVEIVCRATLEVIRGHGGESTRWLPAATSAARVVLDELARERAEQGAWRRLAGQVPGW
ncbi:MAG TPA: hypothetical protein VNU02_10805 [Candidatus Dormibacteraeota bacterium]|nr:hypothetical protein [Candidatus Dormibacteraeota bacterium]